MSNIVTIYGKLKKMPFRQFSQWMKEYTKACYEEGLREGESEGIWWEDTQVYDILRAERIGPERAQRIVDKLMKVQKNCIKKEGDHGTGIKGPYPGAVGKGPRIP